MIEVGTSLNPLKSGPTFGYLVIKLYERINDKVSIPSNRVLPSVSYLEYYAKVTEFSLNPLKSGPTFGSQRLILHLEGLFRVSIPSNRVLPSVFLNSPASRQFVAKSQSPQIGSYLRF